MWVWIMCFLGRGLTAGAMMALLVAAQAARAEPIVDPARLNTDPTLFGVFERPRPDYDAQGVHWGSFLLLPSLTSTLGYDDNIFASSTFKRDDVVYKVRPELVLKSDWARHAMELVVAGEGVGYADFSGQNHWNFVSGGRGTVDVSGDLTIAGFLNYTHGHEERGTGESFVPFDRPVAFDRIDGGASVNKRFNRLWTSLGVAGRWDNFDDAHIGPRIFDQDYRDGTRGTVTGRVGYELSPLTSVFSELAYNDRSYRLSAFDSQGYRAVGGLMFEPTRLMKGEIYGGYLAQDYQSPLLHDIGTWTVGGKLAWFPTPLMTVSFTGNREAEASIYAGGASRLVTEYGARVDYEVLRNLILSAKAGYETDDFLGTPRTDTYWKFGGGVGWLVNRMLSVTVDYNHIEFDTSVADLGILSVEDYSRNQVGVSAKLKY